jgi:hypothetical protein
MQLARQRLNLQRLARRRAQSRPVVVTGTKKKPAERLKAKAAAVERSA